MKWIYTISALVFIASCSTPEMEEDVCTFESNPSPVFTVPFTDMDIILHIEPLGEVQAVDAFSDHTYVFIKPGVVEAPIYAPIDMTLMNVVGDTEDWALFFKVSKEVWLSFAHITHPEPELLEHVSNSFIDLSQCGDPPRLEVSAGQYLGKTTFTNQSRAFDFGVYNNTRENNFINKERFSMVPSYRHGDCPYDYYTTDLKNKYYNLFGPKPVSQPLSCRGARDVPGTIAGAWFDTKEVIHPVFDNTVFSPLVIATALDGHVKIVRGTEYGIVNRVFPWESTYKDPETVKTEHCYEVSQGGYFFFQLQADGSCKIARHPSNTCPDKFPDEYIHYYR